MNNLKLKKLIRSIQTFNLKNPIIYLAYRKLSSESTVISCIEEYAWTRDIVEMVYTKSRSRDQVL